MPHVRLALLAGGGGKVGGAVNCHRITLQGQYQEKPKLPFVPGNECSGTVTEVGRDVRTLKVGDKVGFHRASVRPCLRICPSVTALIAQGRAQRSCSGLAAASSLLCSPQQHCWCARLRPAGVRRYHGRGLL